MLVYFTVLFSAMQLYFSFSLFFSFSMQGKTKSIIRPSHFNANLVSQSQAFKSWQRLDLCFSLFNDRRTTCSAISCHLPQEKKNLTWLRSILTELKKWEIRQLWIIYQWIKIREKGWNFSTLLRLIKLVSLSKVLFTLISFQKYQGWFLPKFMHQCPVPGVHILCTTQRGVGRKTARGCG